MDASGWGSHWGSRILWISYGPGPVGPVSGSMGGGAVGGWDGPRWRLGALGTGLLGWGWVPYGMGPWAHMDGHPMGSHMLYVGSWATHGCLATHGHPLFPMTAAQGPLSHPLFIFYVAFCNRLQFT